MRKVELLAQYNRKRLQRGLDTPASETLTKAEIQNGLYQIETMPDSLPQDIPPQSVATLFKKLNIIRKRQKKPVLKSWKGSRADLEQLILKHEIDTKHIEIQKLKTVIAKGANTIRFHTTMHKNKVEEAIQRMLKKEIRNKVKAQRVLAAGLSVQSTESFSSIIAWLQIRGYLSMKDIPHTYVADIRKFVEDRKAARKGL